ncbi:MAG: hypothetical protein A3K76_03575 [Euryarchaeota archaeon RBG_13_57_23]|nr:MAG: hypothetical protein A3K76_03575 [Euryarchaeota archaeon RBG_13_57_23]
MRALVLEVVEVDEKGFRKFVAEGKRVPPNLSESTIRQNIRTVKEFETLLRKRNAKKVFSNATANDVKAFVRQQNKKKADMWTNHLGLLRYSRFAGNEEVELALLLMLDGYDVLGKLTEAVVKEIGRKKSKRILKGFKLPEIGTSPKRFPKVTKEFMNRLESNLDQHTCRRILLTGVHAGPPEYYLDEKKMLRESKNVDEYLSKRRKKLIKELSEHMKNDTLFFTQRIDKKSLDFVKKNPEVAGGVRKGDRIFQTKIPYMMIECLGEKDPTMRRYYYCHCPLARESILSGLKISQDFCYCSAGYEKRPYEVAFGEPVETEVLQSVLWGDPVCRFAMRIPKKYLAGKL